MVGKIVEFPIAAGVYETGVVRSFNETNGRLEVISDAGETWYGYEYQVSIVN